MEEKGKVAETGNVALFRSPENVYLVVYTPRRAAAPRAEGTTLRSKKMNM